MGRKLKLTLVPLPTTPRKCLRCGETFPSEGPGNRLCEGCNRYNAAIALVRVEVIDGGGRVIRKGSGD